MELEEVKRFKIAEDEKLVVRYSDTKTPQFLDELSRQFQILLPGVKVLILSGVAEIAVIKEDSVSGGTEHAKDSPKISRHKP